MVYPTVHVNRNETVRRGAWMVVGFLWVAYFLNYMDRQTVFSIYPALRRDLHFTDAQLGLVGSTFLWVYALCLTVSGRLADLMRRERIVIASLILWSVAMLGAGSSGSVVAFLFWRGMIGLTESLYFPAAVGLIAVMHPGATRSRALSVHSTAQVCGIVAAGSYGGWAADHIGWRAGFFAIAVAGIGYAFVLCAGLRNVPRRSAVQAARPTSPMDVMRSRCYRAYVLAFFMFCMMLWMLYAWLPDYIYEHYHLSMTESGFTATVYLQTSSAVGILTGGVLADWLVKRIRFGRFCISSAGLLLCAPFAYLALATTSLAALKLCAASFGFFAGSLMSNNVASVYDVTAEANYGFAVGWLNVLGGMAGATAAFLAGLWKQSVGIVTMMGWVAFGACCAAGWLIWVTLANFEKDRSRFCAPLARPEAT
jgi:predicted MFS family arabinose efflux permease